LLGGSAGKEKNATWPGDRVLGLLAGASRPACEALKQSLLEKGKEKGDTGGSSGGGDLSWALALRKNGSVQVQIRFKKYRSSRGGGREH